MYFKVIKSSMDGICGGESRYENIKDVLQEIHFHKGWESKEQLHKAIRKWAKGAQPGSVFTTQVSAVIAFGVDRCSREDDVCHHCGHEGLDYDDLGPVEDGNIEQEVTCPECGKRWMDVFALVEQNELFSAKGGE